jgi:dihydrofolate synthase/folylpolyglutamate synthase
VAAAAATLRTDFRSEGPLVLVLGCNRPRDPTELLEPFAAAEPSLVVATAADWAKAVPAEEVAAAAAGVGLTAQVVPHVPGAVDTAVARAGADGTVLVSGSLYVVGEARTYLR